MLAGAGGGPGEGGVGVGGFGGGVGVGGVALDVITELDAGEATRCWRHVASLKKHTLPFVSYTAAAHGTGFVEFAQKLQQSWSLATLLCAPQSAPKTPIEGIGEPHVCASVEASRLRYAPITILFAAT